MRVGSVEWFIEIIGAEIKKQFMEEMMFQLYIKANINNKGGTDKDTDIWECMAY